MGTTDRSVNKRQVPKAETQKKFSLTAVMSVLGFSSWKRGKDSSARYGKVPRVSKKRKNHLENKARAINAKKVKTW